MLFCLMRQSHFASWNNFWRHFMQRVSYPYAAPRSTRHPDDRRIRSYPSMLAGHSLFVLLAAGLLCVVVLSAPGVHAQVQNGTIQGIVTDTGGAVVPDANVTVRQVATNLL